MRDNPHWIFDIQGFNRWEKMLATGKFEIA